MDAGAEDWLVTDEQDVVVARCYRHPLDPPEWARGNAVRFAAAPELYEALKAMHDEFAYAGMEGEQDAACALAWAALAKARGEEV